MSGILQGVYAFTGIVRFWDIQRSLETEPDGLLRANALYERWRQVIEPVACTLLGTGLLTPVGTRFVTVLREQGQGQESGPMPAEADEIAREVVLDHRLTWQLRHMALDGAEVAALAAAYRRGEPLGGRALPQARIEDDVRKVDSIARSRLLNMRCQDPQRYRALSVADIPGLGAADDFLVRGNAVAAAAAYRAWLAAEPDPAAWIGLALAIHRLSGMSPRSAFTTRLPLLFEMHACLGDQGIHADPLDLAAWCE
jgi:hypothetical protein